MSMSRKSFGIVLPIALLSYFLILMDNSIVFTSSREIGADLGLDAVGMAWISNAYTLTFGGFLLLSGRLSDLLGRKQNISNRDGYFWYSISRCRYCYRCNDNDYRSGRTRYR